MSDQSSVPPFSRDGGAPFIYFDVVPTNGIFNGAIQIELASRIIIPGDPDPKIEFLINGHLRCSPAAALALRDAINNSLQMLEQASIPQQAASNTLN
ncbi:hypothetical protein [Rhizobium rhizoryzae]|uniref:DUF3467 domain-containing protein n=1 Tax=Rhizobium rhizoryzae TaxID=451876 RepID=A0A7W6LE68_9HYPH|nr:hypothetical protein [Rhizobium rhizoryzae]MBB4142730.1 hypothetical protein [Rhizobium rhizoryzae]